MANYPPRQQAAMMPMPPQPVAPTRPNPFQMVFHVGRTARLAGALLTDPRVTIYRKLLFVGSIILLILALLAPETIGGAVSSFLPPLLGIEVPVDATLDWVAVGLAAFNLLRVFPQEVVTYHYNRLFHAPAK
jgi:sterol desaturase/sphingolipid hydroxylase (fatty acid hydroxylase superfamily)